MQVKQPLPHVRLPPSLFLNGPDALALIADLRNLVVHPNSDTGWFCCYEDHMKHLLGFLSSPPSDGDTPWATFREEAATQISLCRQCAITYHRIAIEWEREIVGLLGRADGRTKILSLLKWETDRLFRSIRRGTKPQEMADAADKIACREAFLECLLSPRLMMDKNIFCILTIVFKKNTPVENDYLQSFFDTLTFIPPGLAVLCFHRSNVVQAWAHRRLKESVAKHQFQAPPLKLVLLKVLQTLQGRLGLSEGMTASIFATEVDSNTLWRGIAFILSALSSNLLSSVLQALKPATVFEAIMAALKANRDEAEYAGACAEVFLKRVPLTKEMFGNYFDIDCMLATLFSCFRKANALLIVRQQVIKLVIQVIHASYRKSQSDMILNFKKCLFFYERQLQCLANPSAFSQSSQKDAPDREVILNGAAHLIIWYYEDTVPPVPPQMTKTIATFVITILREGTKHKWAWDLLRVILSTDLFNLIQITRPATDIQLIHEAYFSSRPPSMDGVTESRLKVGRLLRPSLSDAKVSLTFLTELWNELYKGKHMYKDTVCDEELKVLLDLHILIGMIDPERVTTSAGKNLDKITFSGICGTEVDNGRGYLVDCIRLMQSTVISRLSKALNSSQQPCWQDLPFHASHLLVSENKQLTCLSLQALVTMNNMGNATIQGSQSKLIARVMKCNPARSQLIAHGMSATMKIIFALGKEVALQSFARFFLWYRVLLDCDYREVLASHNCSKWIVGVILGVLSSWKDFEKTAKPADFNEFCIRFTSNLRDLWLHLHGFNQLSSPKGDGDDELKSWHKKMISHLIEMNELKDPIPRGAWLNAILKIGPSWSNEPQYRTKMVDVIKAHHGHRQGLTASQCQALSDCFNLKEVDALVSLWLEEEIQRDMKQQQLQKAFAPKKLVPTKIDSFFSGAGTRAGLKTGRFATSKPEQPKQVPPNSSSFDKKPLHSLVQRPTPVQETRPPKQPGSSLLSDLRKQQRELASEKLRPKAKPHPTVPVKTKYELAREKALAEREERNRERAARELEEADNEVRRKNGILRRQNMGPLSDRANIPCRARMNGNDQVQVNEKPKEENLKFPSSWKSVEAPTFECIHHEFLASKSLFWKKESDYIQLKGKFPDVSAYCAHWQPLVLEELRASIESLVREENRFAAAHLSNTVYRGCRTIFEVEKAVEVVGRVQKLALKQAADETNQRHDNSQSEFDSDRTRAGDIVFIDLATDAPAFVQNSPSFAVAYVSAVNFSRGLMSLNINCGFPSTDKAPGMGRKVRVSRLSSLIPFRRQFDALWGISSLPDGMLWPLMDPSRGLEVNEKMKIRTNKSTAGDISMPLSFVSDLHKNNKLNRSQAGAITAVLEACKPIFTAASLVGSNPDQTGGISLIQGPPGTGKTSTIIALMSAFILSKPQNLRRPKVRVPVSKGFVVHTLAPVRILVCAPSNAAVDEIMLRVMNDGLFTPSGHRATPRMVRVGGGTTIEALEELEVRRLAKCDNHEKKGNDGKKFNEYLSQVQSVGSKIGAAIEERQRYRDKLKKLNAEKEKTTETSEDISDLEKKAKALTDCLSTLHEQKAQLNELLTKERRNMKDAQDQKKEQNNLAIFKVMSSATVVFATLNSAGNENMVNFGGKFNLIIVDEAAQCCEPDILIPLTVGTNSARTTRPSGHLVMVGDPKQLPATILSQKRSVERALGRSFFERLSAQSPTSVHMLDTQYRMHPAISAFPSEQFYQNRLKNGANVEGDEMQQPYHLDEKRRFGPLTLLDTSATSAQESFSSASSMFNMEEVRIVMNILTVLARQQDVTLLYGNIVVLSPYRDQVTRLRRMVADSPVARKLEVEVSTVDGIQGREKSIVIMSTVRGGTGKTIGFVKDERRMNVALTRAKHSLIVVGNAKALAENSEAWGDFVSHCKEKNSHIELPTNSATFFPELRRDYETGARRQFNVPASKKRQTHEPRGQNIKSRPRKGMELVEAPRNPPPSRAPTKHAPGPPSRKRGRSPIRPDPDHEKAKRVRMEKQEGRRPPDAVPEERSEAGKQPDRRPREHHGPDSTGTGRTEARRLQPGPPAMIHRMQNERQLEVGSTSGGQTPNERQIAPIALRSRNPADVTPVEVRTRAPSDVQRKVLSPSGHGAMSTLLRSRPLPVNDQFGTTAPSTREHVQQGRDPPESKRQVRETLGFDKERDRHKRQHTENLRDVIVRGHDTNTSVRAPEESAENAIRQHGNRGDEGYRSANPGANPDGREQHRRTPLDARAPRQDQGRYHGRDYPSHGFRDRNNGDERVASGYGARERFENHRERDGRGGRRGAFDGYECPRGGGHPGERNGGGGGGGNGYRNGDGAVQDAHHVIDHQHRAGYAADADPARRYDGRSDGRWDGRDRGNDWGRGGRNRGRYRGRDHGRDGRGRRGRRW